MAFLIILLGLWAYPIISLLLIQFTKKRLSLRKPVFVVSSVLTLLALFGLLTNISTTLSELDWVIFSTIYFTISLVLVWTQFQKNKLLKVLGFIAMFIVFAFGYLSGTIGALGVGFVVGEYDTEYEKWLGNGIIYKESLLGNAISDHRGKKVELYKTITWLPFIEWKIQEKTYTEYVRCMSTPSTINFNSKDNKVYIYGSMWSEQDEKHIYWNDTLTVGKNN
jgi:hypothetical protein